jgi:hypothetical protein
MPQNSAASVRIDKDLRRAKHRRALREAFLQKLNVGQDESRIRALVKQYLELARSSGEQVVKAKGNRELLHEFFKDAVALFLLASEPRSLASKLMSVLYGQHKDRVRKHVNTTLLAFILKTLGPYPRQERRTIHRDTVALEYLICRGVMPNDLPQFLESQGLDRTYHIAQNFFIGHRRPSKYELAIKPKPARKLSERKSRGVFVALMKKDDQKFLMTDCLTDLDMIKAVMEYVCDAAKQKGKK